MTDSTHLKLPYILAAQAQKHVTHNEAIRALDALVQLAVLDRNLAAPPVSPAEGARYIVAPGASGAWSGQVDRVAAFQDGAWSFYAPNEGWIAWIADEDTLVAWNGTAWVATGGGGGGSISLNPATGGLVGINTTADATNKLAVASAASLFNHNGAGHQMKLNKAAAANTASLLFQDAFSGRAEIGLTGDDDLHVKVSANGSSWFEGLRIDRNTGKVALPLGLQTALGLADGGTGATMAAQALVNFGIPGLKKLGATINDDNVATFALGDLFGALIQFFGNSTAVPRGIIFIRGAIGNNQIASVAHSGSVGLYTTVLTGTTGTDGQINIGVAGTSGAHSLYVENRVGFIAGVHIWLLPSA